MNAPARYIVTRDKDLLEASPGEKYAIAKVGPGIRDVPIKVATVEEFLDEVLGRQTARVNVVDLELRRRFRTALRRSVAKLRRVVWPVSG